MYRFSPLNSISINSMQKSLDTLAQYKRRISPITLLWIMLLLVFSNMLITIYMYMRRGDSFRDKDTNALHVLQKPPLQARYVNTFEYPNGALKFKILQIADTHYTGNKGFKCRDPPKIFNGMKEPCVEERMTEFIGNLLDLEKPDMVVFTGDQIEAIEVKRSVFELNKALYDVYSEVIEREIPWAMVFGNHDEGVSCRINVYEMYR